MSIIDKIMSFIKKTWNKERVKTLEPPKQVVYKEIRNDLDQSIKVTLQDTPIEKKNEIETLICPGDGLGIQREIKG